jgi:hypothetical protein
VDGNNPDDTNVLYLAKNGYVKIAYAFLSFRFFLDADLHPSNSFQNRIINPLRNQVHPKNKSRVSPQDEEIDENIEEDTPAIDHEREDEVVQECGLDVVQHNFKCIYKCSSKQSFEDNLKYVLHWVEIKHTLVGDKNSRRNEMALLLHEDTIEYVRKVNFRISVLKAKAVTILLELLYTNTISLNKVYYTIHTQLPPNTIRLNFICQDALFEKLHQKKYRIQLFNK